MVLPSGLKMGLVFMEVWRHKIFSIFAPKEVGDTHRHDRYANMASKSRAAQQQQNYLSNKIERKV